MSASVSPPTAAPAGAPSAPRPNPTGELQNGAGFGATPSMPTSASASPSTTPGPHPVPADHSLAITGRPANGLNTSLTSTPIVRHSKSPPAQIVSDIPGTGPSANSIAQPSHAHNKSNAITISGASHSPALPSTPANPNHVLPNRSGTDPQGWQRQTTSSTPIQASVINSARSTGNSSPAPRISVGFPSPKSEAMQTNQKFLDDCDRLKFGIQQALPEAVRRSVRDNWEACLLGSPFHQAFVLNASIHHATPAAIQRGMHDFGKTLISNAKTAIVDQMTTSDLDELADLILSKASVAFYDKCLEKRLKTIDAKRLINALARAQRLGYELDDVQEEEEDEENVPSTQAQHPPTPSPALPTPNQVLHCGVCFRRFPTQSAHNYHVSHKVCTRSPSSPGGFKYNCLHCGQGFTTPMGLQYHNTNKVCGDFGEPVKANLLKKPAVPTPYSSGSQSHTPIPVPSIPSHSVIQSSSPATPSIPKTASPAPIHPSTNTTDLNGDPYSHLSPEQLAALQSELREAEIAFIERVRQASLVVDPAEKKAKVDGFANSFSTKQSLIRKKYGVRLRQRRNKTEIQQERDRVHYKTASEIQAEMGIINTGPGRTPTASSYSSQRPDMRASSTNGAGWAPVNQQLTTPASKIAGSTDGGMPGPGKRRLSGGASEMSNSKRVAYANMAGSSEINAEAETMDPTVFKGSLGTKEEPMALDDSSSESSEGGSGSDGGSGDEDIPAELPASVKQTLVRSSPASMDRGSRAASSSAAAGM